MKKICLLILVSAWSVLPMLATNQAPTTLVQELAESEDYINYICEGTTWELTYEDPQFDSENNKLEVTIRNMRLWLEGSHEIDGKQYMALMRAKDIDNYATCSRIAYIRYDNGKVYRKYETKPEELLYDFNLNVEDSCTLFYDEAYPEVNAECVGIREISSEGNKYKMMDISLTGSAYLPPEAGDISGDLIPELNEKKCWIKGLGGSNGLPSNAAFKSWLTAIFYNGTLIYKPAASGIENIQLSSPEIRSSGAYHIDGKPFKEGDTGICIINGKKIMK